MYGFSISTEKPGSFDLVFMHFKGKVKSEPVTVQSDGFLFRMRKFRDVDSLLRFFKEDEQKKLKKLMTENKDQFPPARPDQSQSRRPRDGHRDHNPREGTGREQGGMHPSRAAMVSNSRK
jgi:hypothetical protein